MASSVLRFDEAHRLVAAGTICMYLVLLPVGREGPVTHPPVEPSATMLPDYDALLS